MFIDNQQCRKSLETYAKTATSRDELGRYIVSDMEQLIHLLEQHCASLACLLKNLDKPIPCPSHCARLFTALSCMSPVCALVMPATVILELMTKLCNGDEIRKDPIQWKVLENSVPVIYNFICAMGSDVTSIPIEYRPLVSDIVLKAKLPFETTPAHPLLCAKIQVNQKQAYFPNLHVQCHRPTYKADLLRRKGFCTKKYRGHPSLLPGIFTVFCPHGILFWLT